MNAKIALLCCLLVLAHVTGLAQFECGIYVQPSGIPPGYQGDAYYDRFGNSYTDHHLISMMNKTEEACTSGPFTLNFLGGFTADEMETICLAFERAGTLIGANSGIEVPIIVIKEPETYEHGSAAASDFFYEDCGIARNSVQRILRTGVNPFPPGRPAAMLHVRSVPNIGQTWHTWAQDAPDHINPVLTSDEVDLFSAVLHEAFHMLGFGSLIGLNGASGPGGVYTIWDMFLFNQNTNLYLISTSSNPAASCCDEHQFLGLNAADLPKGCDGNIYFRADNQLIAPVNALNYVDPSDNATMYNKLSHLEPACPPGANYLNQAYLMQSILQPSVVRRNPTEAEVAILCHIGYPAAASCNENCVVAANNDQVPELIVLSGSGLNLTVNIPFTQLLLNDVSPGWPNVDVQLVPGCGTGITNGAITAQLNTTSDGFLVTGITPGVWTFCYSITPNNPNCENAKCSQAEVRVTVMQSLVETACNTADCNLVCFGDFEDFMPGNNNYFAQTGLSSFGFDTQSPNSPDVYSINDDGNGLHLVFGPESDDEVVYMPLGAPLPPGCTATISFDATGYGIEYFNTPTLAFYGLSDPPCDDIPLPACNNNPISLCAPPLQSNAFCLTGQQFPNQLFGAPIHFDAQVTSLQDGVLDADLEHYTFTWTNNTGVAITDLLVFGYFQDGVIHDYHYLLDNLNITSACTPQIAITPTVQQQCLNGMAVIEYEICLVGITTAPLTLNLNTILPPGMTIIPGGGFDQNGSATVTLPQNPSGNTLCVTNPLILTMSVGGSYQQGDIAIVGIDAQSSGACINTQNETGEAVLILQDCGPAGLCACPPNAGYNVGFNMNSEIKLSMSNLPSNLNNTCITINGKLIVDQNLNLSQCHVTMNQGAEIEVRGKALLTLQRNIIEGCQHMWKGITVKGGIHAEDNTIRDAQWAVRCENKSSIWVQNNFFEQNYVAFYTPPLAPLTASVNTVRILGNLVTGAGLLKPAYGSSDPNTPHPQIPAPGERSFAGAFLNDVSGFIIDAGNQFVQLRNGVIAYRSTFSFKQSEIADLISFVYPTGAEPEPAFHHNLSGIRAYDCLLADISGNEIQHVFKGVYSERSNIKAVDNGILTDILSSPTEVDEPWRASAIDVFFGNNKTTELLQNRIETWADGIYVSTCDPSGSLKIIENEVKKHPHTTNDDFFAGMGIGITRFGEIAGNRIKMMAPSGATGFTMNNCRNLFIHDNEFLDFEVGMRGNSNVSCYLLDNTAQSDVTSGSAAGTAGIGFTNAFSDNDYCCNTVNHLSAEGFVFDGPSTGTSFRYSQIYGATMGLLLTESAEISPQTHARNRWYAGNGGAFHASEDFNVIMNSLFICEPALIPPFATAADQPGAPVLWFEGQPLPPGPPQPLCNCPYPVDPGGGGGDLPRIMPEIDDLTAIGGHELGQYSDAYNWMTQQRLYARLAQAPELATTTAAINQFYLTSQSDLIGQYSTVGANIQNLIGRDGYTRGLLLEANADIAVLMSEVRALELNPNLNAPLLEQKREALKASAGYLNGIGANIEQAQEGALNPLLAQNDALFEPEIFQANEKTVNRIELENRLWESRSVAPADLAVLQQIAGQCPLEGGFSVFEARGLLKMMGQPNTGEANSTCMPVQYHNAISNSRTSQVAVYPVPSDQAVFFTNLSNEEEGFIIEVFNLQGEIILHRELQREFVWKVEHLMPGIYVYHVRTNGGKNDTTGKIVITH